MQLEEFYGLFADIFAKNGLQRLVKAETVELFWRFTHLFLDANAKFNLTAIREIPEVIAKHYADCLLAEKDFPQGAAVLDLGCGGGFPTFPLAIARPDLRITALDSTQKKIDFVAMAARELRLGNIQVRCDRAEAAANDDLRNRFDVVTSRAMARMNVLVEIGLPCARLGGKMVVLKGLQGAEEAAEAANCIHLMGGRLLSDELLELQTPSTNETRRILTVEKRSGTPKQYPRSYAAILKKPF